MRLSELAAAVKGIEPPSRDCEILGMNIDSRKVQPGDLFLCLPGLHVDGHKFAEQAVEKGAVALVVEHALPIDVPQVIVPDARAATSYMAQCFYGYPAKAMTMIGVGGTKGKTTTSFLVHSIMSAAGRKCGLVGSAMNLVGSEVVHEKMTTPTTPDSIELQWLLRRMLDGGCDCVVMEVTAHAMEFRRIEGMVFDAGIFANFTQDHLELFKTMDNYFEAKLRFYDKAFCGWAAVNADADRHERILGRLPTATFGVSNASDAYARDIEVREDGLSFVLQYDKLRLPLHLRLSSLFNVYNALAAAVTCLYLGASPEAVKAGLESIRSVPGRMEIIETDTPYRVYLDFAHSPASLRSILEASRQFTKNRLICVFGCGGDRDREKRPLMGQISGEYADFSILTSDNPRTEEPERIIDQIEEGIAPTGARYIRIENRREAIRHALNMAQAGDIIVLAGKGDEDYQEINGKRYPFDEKKIVKELLGQDK